jgi:hypothetical protein
VSEISTWMGAYYRLSCGERGQHLDGCPLKVKKQSKALISIGGLILYIREKV